MMASVLTDKRCLYCGVFRPGHRFDYWPRGASRKLAHGKKEHPDSTLIPPPPLCVPPNNSVTFSGDRMEEASVVRARFQRFLALADATIRAARKDRPAGGTALRWGQKEKWLVEETSNCRRWARKARTNEKCICFLSSFRRNITQGLPRKCPDLSPVRQYPTFCRRKVPSPTAVPRSIVKMG